MRKILLILALVTGVASAHAQSADTTAVNDLTLNADIYPGQEDGDIYHGLSRKLTFDRMIPPYGLEVTYGKTTHIIFPSAVRYVDLGSPNLIAGKADGAENVIRVKATVRNFREETNMSVITESGSFYTFNVKYADEPLLLNIEMKDFIHDGSGVNRPNNAAARRSASSTCCAGSIPTTGCSISTRRSGIRQTCPMTWISSRLKLWTRKSSNARPSRSR